MVALGEEGGAERYFAGDVLWRDLSEFADGMCPAVVKDKIARHSTNNGILDIRTWLDQPHLFSRALLNSNGSLGS